jgi:hypothetical protein
MTDPVDKCIFCGNPDSSKLTWEHLWPRWSHRQIVRSMRRWQGMHVIQRIEPDIIEASETKATKQGGDVHDMQVHCVCGGDSKSCNNGWMRNLENLARPILTPLMNGIEVRLSPERQKIVAGWAALKAMVAEFDDLGHVTTTLAERDHMRLFRLPPDRGWGIWLAILSVGTGLDT